MEGIILPRVGSPEVGPLVIKASAGIAFRAPILRCLSAQEAAEALSAANFSLFGLKGDGAENLYETHFPERLVFVLGNESRGISLRVHRSLYIPMCNGVESLNVATAGAILSFELLRRAQSG